MPQETQIPAADEGGGIAGERDDGGPQWGGLPWFAQDAPFPEERYADLAVARACGATVGGLHHQAEPLTLVSGHAGVARDRARLQHLPEPLDRFYPARQIVIKGQQDSHGTGAGAPGHVQKRNRTIRAQSAKAPLLCFRLRRQIKRNGPRQGWPETGYLAQKHGGRIGVR